MADDEHADRDGARHIAPGDVITAGEQEPPDHTHQEAVRIGI